ncbi:Uncharacterised protein [Vibrio cholerae]|nr:Uncharacterised protein [Vibrio cholerae]
MHGLQYRAQVLQKRWFMRPPRLINAVCQLYLLRILAIAHFLRFQMKC